MSTEAMKQALEAMIQVSPSHHLMPNRVGPKEAFDQLMAAITTLRTAIEQAEKQDGDCQKCGGQGCVACDARKQEPVAWRYTSRLGNSYLTDKRSEPSPDWIETPLYTTPPAAPVQEPPPECETEAEKRAYAFGWWKALEANRAAPVQEPESFEEWNAKQHGDPEEIGLLQALRIAYCAGQDSVTKSTPPAAQRQWVGLTDEDKLRLLPTVQLKDEDPKSQVWLTRKDAFAYADALDAKLREKNGGQA
jgi:hypothetical protein